LDLSFGQFRLDTSRKMLWRGNSFVPLGARAYAILTALLETPGRVVSKNELFERAWPGVTVDGANLRIQIANLRRALGDLGAHIVTEQSLGYSYTGQVRRIRDPDALPTFQRFHAPVSLLKPLGREQVISSLNKALENNRLVSIVGPGGIGKTTLALEVTHGTPNEFADGVCFVDVSNSTDAETFSMAIASALGRPVTENPTEDVRNYLRTRRILLVLDCCERAIEGAADVTSALLSAAPGVTVLATSREAMRITGEFVEHLGGLALSPEGDITAQEAFDFASVALFCRTAAATNSEFRLTDDNAALVANICRQLDGIPLAIDLAAGLTGALSLEQIAQSLAERMSLLTFGRRGGTPRHRTMEAAIAWSYDTLDIKDATALRRLSIFPDSFSLKAALDVITFGELDRSAAEFAVISLTQKSLLKADLLNRVPVYRLLDTTRFFAAARLVEDERRQVSKNHAYYVLGYLPQIEVHKRDFNKAFAVGFAKDIQVAIQWAMSDEEDVLLPVYLTLAAEPIWFKLQLFSEHNKRFTEARASLASMEIEASKKQQVLAAVMTGISSSVLYDMGADEKILDIVDALKLARTVNSPSLVMRNLSYANTFHVVRHHGVDALSYAKELLEKGRQAGREDVIAYASVAIANALLQTGDWVEAREINDAYLANPLVVDGSRPLTDIGFAGHYLAYLVRAILDGSQGHVTRCLDYINQALAFTSDAERERNRFHVLYLAGCRMACRFGDFETARAYLDMLERLAQNYPPRQDLITGYQGWVAFGEGRLSEARDLLEFFCSFPATKTLLSGTIHLVLSDVRRLLGDFDGAEEAALEVFKVRAGEHDPFMVGASLRARADILVARGSNDGFLEAAELYQGAIANAKAHGAIVVEIPATLGLARLQILQGRTDDARGILTDLIARVPDRHDLGPVQEIYHLLEEIEATRAAGPSSFGKDLSHTRRTTSETLGP
jgi:predicted ATPase/DNA-binding winged helix-turn-helix (wHTH) protein